MKNRTFIPSASLFFAHSVASIYSRAFAAITLFFLNATSIQAQLPTGWAGIDIGGSTAGSNSYSGGVYTIVGSGTGIGNPSDQLHFTYDTLSSGGNFRLTCRVASFNGTSGSEVGVMVRQGISATGSIGAVTYQPASGSGTNPNSFGIFSRNTTTAALYPWIAYNDNYSAMAAPCYLQLVRFGNTFAVYKSIDGTFWSQIYNTSGGVFSATGTIQVGFFVSSGGTSTATATIDSVNLDTAPTLPYETSWIGNSSSDDFNGYVSGCATAMWTGSDGSCYVVGFWDEGGEEGKIYKNGKVASEFQLPAAASYEGSITGDGTHLYYVGWLTQRQIYQTDMTAGLNGNTHQMYLQSSVLNSSGIPQVSGMACGNGELYVSDALTNQILVLNPSQTNYGIASYAPNLVTTSTIDTSAVTNPAPQAVYQSGFLCDLLTMTVPGLTANTSYTVRLHFAEINPSDNAVGKRTMNLYVGGQMITGYDIYAATGALNKATTVTFNSVTSDGSGNLPVTVQRGSGSQDGWALLNGIEILNTGGTQVAAINCGGASVGSWLSSINELPGRGFSFIRPGPLAVDSNGNLWIVQEGTTFPATQNFNYITGGGAIKLYDKNGNYLNKEITDVVSPTALVYDAINDRLLVTENGPDQDVRIYNVYSGTSTPATCTGTLGVAGGVFAGSTPGLIHDPASGGDARFHGPTGVGLDGSGNIYVASNPGENQTDLRSFTSAGALNWSLFGLEMTDTGDFDPTVSASDIWTVTHHYSMNYSSSVAGSEWALKSYMVDPFAAYPMAPNLTGGAAIFRRIGTTPLLYTTGQGSIGTVYIYRFAGEQIIPCGSFTDNGAGSFLIWTDANGDGIQQPGEVTTASDVGGSSGVDIDSSGNIYFAMSGNNPGKVQEYACTGLNSVGAPMYSSSSTVTAAPSPFGTAWGNSARLRYVGGPLDTMYLMGPTYINPSNLNSGGTLACYDHWSTGPVTRFVTVLPAPDTTTNLTYGSPPYTDYVGFFYNAFDVANGVSFCSDNWGTIHVVDPAGNLVTNLVPGPEVSGQNGWEDQAMGVRAHYNPTTAEYAVLQENSGLRARENLYRWTSPGSFLVGLDIGSPGLAGSSTMTPAGVYTVEGGGADIWDVADSFQYDYQALSGNGTIVARVTSMTNTNQWAKAGVMIRETLTSGANEVSMLITPTSSNGATFQWRATTGAISGNVPYSGVAATYWVKLVRSGNTFTGYISPDGVTWTTVATNTISMASSVYVGLAVTAHDNTQLCTATFDHVKITSP